MKGIYYQCENCGQISYNDYPMAWIHIHSFFLQVQKGRWADRDLTYENDYNKFSNLAFCSFQCFFDWCAKKFPNACQIVNPSQR